MKKNILISQPGFQYKDYENVHLPYLYALLKSFAERDDQIVKEWNWLFPIYVFDELEVYKEKLKEQQIHILGLSCYIWNWTFQLQIAKYVKELYPDCLVVMGGPQPDWKDEYFFQKYPFVDAVVRRDGELPFYEILKSFETGDYSHIPGLYLNLNGERVDTGAPVLNTDFEHEPYHHTHQEMQEILSSSKKATAIMETNRGCPYRCSFCEMGAKDLSKLRQIDEDRVYREMDWFSENKVNSVFIMDSNWGILNRDIEFSQRFADLKTKNGFPRKLEFDSKCTADKKNAIAGQKYDGQAIGLN